MFGLKKGNFGQLGSQLSCSQNDPRGPKESSRDVRSPHENERNSETKRAIWMGPSPKPSQCRLTQNYANNICS